MTPAILGRGGTSFQSGKERVAMHTDTANEWEGFRGWRSEGAELG